MDSTIHVLSDDVLFHDIIGKLDPEKPGEIPFHPQIVLACARKGLYCWGPKDLAKLLTLTAAASDPSSFTVKVQAALRANLTVLKGYSFYSMIEFDDANFALLCGALPNLREIDVSASNVTCSGLRCISGLTTLSSLKCYFSKLESAETAESTVAFLASLPTLRDLSVAFHSQGITFPENIFDPLTSLALLTRLSLRHTVAVEGAFLPRLTALSNLRSLDLGYALMSNAHTINIECLSSFVRLTELDLSSTQVIGKTISALAHLTDLRGLSLRSCTSFDAPSFSSALQKLSGLTKLDLCYSESVTSEIVSSIGANCPLLERLELYSCPLVNGDLVYLAALTRLTFLDLTSCLKSSTALLPLADLKELRHLNIARCLSVTGPQALDVISRNFTQLTYLNLAQSCEGLEDEHLPLFSSLRRLQELRISNNDRITDAGVLHLSSLRKLRLIQLSTITSITDAALAAFSRLHSLTSAELYGATHIEGTGLLHLGRLPNLERVDLSYSSVKVDLLKVLATDGLFPRLSYVDCCECTDFENAYGRDLPSEFGLGPRGDGRHIHVRYLERGAAIVI